MLLIFEPEVNIWLNLSPQRNGAADVCPCLKSSPLFFTCMVLFHLVWVAIRAGQEEPCSLPGFLTPFPHRSFSASAELAQQILARMTVQKMGKLSPFFPISLPYMDLAQTSSPPARAGSREKRFGKAKPFMVASALLALLFIKTYHTKWKRTIQDKSLMSGFNPIDRGQAEFFFVVPKKCPGNRKRPAKCVE